jgi:two-component system secretion system response regulator SalR
MNILLIDDHGMFTESLKLTLERDARIKKINILQDIDKVKQKILNKEYDITLMDINIKKITGDKDGLAIAKELLDEDDTLKIVMLIGFDMPGYESEAQKIGAKGFICKDEYTDVLIEKLVKVYSGESVFRRKDNEMDELTEREKEILILYSSGLSRREVANKCEISVSSLAVTLNRIYEKLDVKNYQEMVNKALEIGYIKPSFF